MCLHLSENELLKKLKYILESGICLSPLLHVILSNVELSIITAHIGGIQWCSQMYTDYVQLAHAHPRLQ